MPEHSEGSKRKSAFQWPWSGSGWYTDKVTAQRDPQLDKLIKAEGGGKMNPAGYDNDRPILAVRGAPHNPYSAIVVALMFGAFGLFLLSAVGGAWGVVLLVLFAASAACIVYFNGRRIAAWHRARRVAREYIREHGGKFPNELRVWN